MRSALFTVALLLAVGAGTAQKSVVIPNVGTVVGTQSSDGNVQLFLGIPFGKTTERWQAAQPADFLGNNFDASQFGIPCAQLTEDAFPVFGGEDCLSINIYVPTAYFGQIGLLPVLVWTYGGGFLQGTSRSFNYNATSFVTNNNVIVVTYNYRLGPFGFFGTSTLLNESPSTGNYGLDDARAALTWVQQNIRYFGGDPSKVTAFGESAGGIITCLLAFSPLAEGLFRSAILESGNCDFVSRQQSLTFQVAAQFAAALNCAAGNLTCMRSKSVNEIMNASIALGGTSPFGFGGRVVPWLPSIDRVLVPQNPLVTLFQGTWKPIPIMLGANHDSFSLFMINTPLANISTVPEALQIIEGLIGGDTFTDIRLGLGTMGASDSQYATAKTALLNYYTEKFSYDPRLLFLRAASDYSFICGTRRLAQGFSQYMSDVYLYDFRHHPSMPPTPVWMGAYHFAEVEYVFGNADFASWTPEEQLLSRRMQGYWGGFVRSGNTPNGGYPMGGFPSTLWPGFNSLSDLALGLNLTIEVLPGNNNVSCKLWENLIFASGVWPASVSPANARVAMPQTCSSAVMTSSTNEPSRAGTIAIAVTISVVLICGVALLVWRLNRRSTSGPDGTVNSSLKYKLYES